MKRTLLTLLFVCSAVALFAQSNVRLGLTAHPNLGFLKVEGGKGKGFSTGFTYGLMGDFEFADNYCFATGLTVTTINGSGEILNYAPYHTVANDLSYDVKFKMQYLQIPLSIKLKTDENNDIKWYGQFGLTTDVRIGAKQDVEQDNLPLKKINESATGNTKFFRAGMIIGGGAEYRLSGKTSVMGGLTYNNGLTNMSKKPHTIKNHYVGINLGMFF